MDYKILNPINYLFYSLDIKYITRKVSIPPLAPALHSKPYNKSVVLVWVWLLFYWVWVWPQLFY